MGRSKSSTDRRHEIGHFFHHRLKEDNGVNAGLEFGPAKRSKLRSVTKAVRPVMDRWVVKVVLMHPAILRTGNRQVVKGRMTKEVSDIEVVVEREHLKNLTRLYGANKDRCCDLTYSLPELR